MNDVLKRLFIAALAAGLCASSSSVAQNLPQHPSDQVRVAYGQPKNPAHQSIYKLLRERQVLEKFKEFLSPLRLPRPLLLKVEGCDGVSNAWYENGAVTVCYEYLAEIIQSAPQKTTAAGVTRTDAIVGPILDIFFHEIGHAVFEYLGIPILGREEDAADQFSAYLVLQFAKEDARRLIFGIAYAFGVEAKNTTLNKSAFADEHGLPAQRFYNILCMAYGTDAKLFGDLVSKGHLPKARAEACKTEYEQVSSAMKKLIGPHIDEALAQEVRAKRWLKFDMQ